MPRTDLSSRRALLTGATGGLGRAIAARLAVEGCTLFLTGRREEALGELAGELGAAVAGTRAADLTEAGDVAAVLTAALDALGGVDLLVNNAGVFPVGPFLETDDEAFERTFAVNVRAASALSRGVLPGMLERGFGRILNVGSSSAYAGFAETALYCASKHALLGLSRSLQAEFGARGVQVTCLSPGSIQTDMGRSVRGQDFETFLLPEEVADYVAFLLGHEGHGVSEEVRLNRRTLR